MKDPFETHPDRDWPEDFEHENGNYVNKCRECGLYFRGHKRRFGCKKCYNTPPDWDSIAKMQPPENNKCAHAGCWAQGEMVGFARCMIKYVRPLEQDRDKFSIEFAEFCIRHPRKIELPDGEWEPMSGQQLLVEYKQVLENISGKRT